VELYEENKFEKNMNELKVIEITERQEELMPIEKALMKILTNS